MEASGGRAGGGSRMEPGSAVSGAMAGGGSRRESTAPDLQGGSREMTTAPGVRPRESCEPDSRPDRIPAEEARHAGLEDALAAQDGEKSQWMFGDEEPRREAAADGKSATQGSSISGGKSGDQPDKRQQGQGHAEEQKGSWMGADSPKKGDWGGDGKEAPKDTSKDHLGLGSGNLLSGAVSRDSNSQINKRQRSGEVATESVRENAKRFFYQPQESQVAGGYAAQGKNRALHICQPGVVVTNR